MLRFGLCVGLAVTLGCESEEPSGKTSTFLFCNAECDAGRRCGYDVPENCLAECAANRSGLHSYAPEGVAIVSACIDRLSCSALAQEEAYAPCWDEAEASAPVRQETRAFCGEYARGIFECGYYYPVEQCEREYVLMTGPFLETIASCVTPCETVDQCVDAAWESL